MERQTVEWKKEWKDEFLRAICSFANSKGGVLTVGVDDEGSIVGVSDPKDVMKKISDTVANKLALCPEIEVDESSGIITIVVEPSKVPVEYDGRYYVRTGNTIHEAKGREYDKLVSKRMNTSWMNTPIEGMDEADLDPLALKYFREKAIDAEILSAESISVTDRELLERMRLMIGGNVTRTAVLLFHHEPETIILGATVKVGMFDGSEILYQDNVGGPLIMRPDFLIDLIRMKYQRRRIEYRGLNRVEVDPYPPESLRECILNALMHNDYSSETPIQIRIWDDSMVVSDMGGLPEDWTTEDLLAFHTSQPPNPALSNAFFIAGFVEGWGRGIERIMRGYEGYGVTAPTFKADRFSFSVFMKSVYGSVDPKPTTDEGRGVKPKEREAALLEMMDREDGLSTRDIASELGLVSASHINTNILKPMIESGLVEMTCPERPRSRNQRYRTTPMGRKHLRDTGPSQDRPEPSQNP